MNCPCRCLGCGRLDAVGTSTTAFHAAPAALCTLIAQAEGQDAEPSVFSWLNITLAVLWNAPQADCAAQAGRQAAHHRHSRAGVNARHLAAM